MSLYNMMNWVNPSAFFILPMLGEKHPDSYPRFRDCFAEYEGGGNGEPIKNREIHVYTRVGWGNRNSGYGEEELQVHPNYLRDFDDDFDNTYATYVFSVPNEFQEDFDKVVTGWLKRISDTYKARLYKVYPKLEEKFDELFN